MRKFLALFLVCSFSFLSAQNLNPGDLQFIGIQTRNADYFAFVATDNIPAGTVINFTDHSWDSTGAFRAREELMVWTTPALTKGQVTIMNCSAAPAVASTGGTCVGSLTGLSQSGENIFAFQGTVSSPTFIAGLATQPFISSGSASASTSYLPSGLTLGVNSFQFARLRSNGYYLIDTTNGTVPAVLAMINDTSNWVTADSINLGGVSAWPNWVFFNNTSGGGGGGGNPTGSLPQYAISRVIGINPNTGVADSLNVNCQLIGTVLGINFSTNGLQFTLFDPTGGIGVFKATNLIPPYTVNQGDRVSIFGKIAQFNGLIQINIDSMSVISSGNPIYNPGVITSLGESSESKLVRINGLTLLNATQWPASGLSANVQATNGVDTFVIRIDSDGNIDGSPAPSSTFDVVGIGSQFDNSSPYTSGYQIMPRDTNDIIIGAQPTVNRINYANSSAAFGEASGSNSVFLTFTLPTSRIDTVKMRLIQVAGTPLYGTDYSTNPAAVNDTLTLIIPSGASNASFAFSPINNAIIDPARSIRFRMISSTAGLVIGTQNTTLISITDDDSAIAPSSLPTYPIGSINTSNATTGVSDSLNVNCKIVGIVNSVNYSTNGLQFALYDATGSITVFKSSNVAPPYTVTEGDELRVIGKVSQFNGLTQLTIDSMVIVSRGNTVNPPITVTSLVEAQESKLIQLNGYRLTNPTQWPAANSSANVTITNGTDTVTLRIDSDTNIDGSTAPNSLFSVVGIQSQFDNSAPYTSGYQILPRRITDIIPLTNPQINFAQSVGSIAENGGVFNLPISLNSSMLSNEVVKVAVSNVSGGAVYGTNYTTNPAAVADTITLALNKNSNTVAIPLTVIDNSTFNSNRVIRFELVNNTAGVSLGINPIFTLTITENDPNSSCQCIGEPQALIYPNPSNDHVVFPFEGFQTVEIYNVEGKKVFHSQIPGNQTWNHDLNPGFYLVKWMNNGFPFQQRLIVR
jgi:DNA/RNA endonuclease YhcR with UshA esterase domain